MIDGILSVLLNRIIVGNSYLTVLNLNVNGRVASRNLNCWIKRIAVKYPAVWQLRSVNRIIGLTANCFVSNWGSAVWFSLLLAVFIDKVVSYLVVLSLVANNYNARLSVAGYMHCVNSVVVLVKAD